MPRLVLQSIFSIVLLSAEASLSALSKCQALGTWKEPPTPTIVTHVPSLPCSLPLLPAVAFQGLSNLTQ